MVRGPGTMKTFILDNLLRIIREHKQTRSTDDQWARQENYFSLFFPPIEFSGTKLILYQFVCSIIVWSMLCVTILHINTLNLAVGEHQRLVGAGLSICQIIN